MHLLALHIWILRKCLFIFSSKICITPSASRNIEFASSFVRVKCNLLYREKKWIYKFPKAAISFVMSVCPSAWNNSAPTGRILIKFYIWFSENLSRKLKSDKNPRRITGTLHKDVHLRYPAVFFLRWKISQIKVVEEIKTHILRWVTSFRKSWGLWDKREKYRAAKAATDDNIIQQTSFANWITRATHAHAVILLFLRKHNFADAPQCYVIRRSHYLSCFKCVQCECWL